MSNCPLSGKSSTQVGGLNSGRPKNWKLIVDPSIKKIADKNEKIFRVEGVCHTNPTYTLSVNPHDPRSGISRFHSRSESIDLPIVSFKIDEDYIGVAPAKQVSFFDLNDNVNHRFLQDLCRKCGDIEEAKIYYHPETKRHMGLARVTFKKMRHANACITRYNDTSVMGKKIKVISDPFTKLVREEFRQRSSPPEVEKETKPETPQPVPDDPGGQEVKPQWPTMPWNVPPPQFSGYTLPPPPPIPPVLPPPISVQKAPAVTPPTPTHSNSRGSAYDDASNQIQLLMKEYGTNTDSGRPKTPTSSEKRRRSRWDLKQHPKTTLDDSLERVSSSDEASRASSPRRQAHVDGKAVENVSSSGEDSPCGTPGTLESRIQDILRGAEQQVLKAVKKEARPVKRCINEKEESREPQEEDTLKLPDLSGSPVVVNGTPWVQSPYLIPQQQPPPSHSQRPPNVPYTKCTKDTKFKNSRSYNQSAKERHSHTPIGYSPHLPVKDVPSQYPMGYSNPPKDEYSHPPMQYAHASKTTSHSTPRELEPSKSVICQPSSDYTQCTTSFYTHPPIGYPQPPMGYTQSTAYAQSCKGAYAHPSGTPQFGLYGGDNRHENYTQARTSSPAFVREEQPDVTSHITSALLAAPVYMEMMKDLKDVLRRDVKKKLLELTVFPSVDSWFDNGISFADRVRSVAKEHAILQETDPELCTDSDKPEQTMTSASSARLSSIDMLFNDSGLLGLRASLPKMPSFKRKMPPKEEEERSASRASSHESEDKLKAKMDPLSSDEDNKTNHNQRASAKLKRKRVIDSSSNDERSKKKQVKVDEVASSESTSESDDESESDNTNSASEDDENSEKEEENITKPAKIEVKSSQMPPESVLKRLEPVAIEKVQSVVIEDDHAIMTLIGSYDPRLYEHSYVLDPKRAPFFITPVLPKPLIDYKKQSSSKKKASHKKKIEENETKDALDLYKLVSERGDALRRNEMEKEKKSQLAFKERTLRHEIKCVNAFADKGFDTEDRNLLKIAFEQAKALHTKLKPAFWGLGHQTVDEGVAPSKRRRVIEERGAHKTGSARTEGYYKLTGRDKRTLMRRAHRGAGDEVFERTHMQSQADVAAARQQVQLGREARILQRRLLTTLGVDPEQSELLKFNQLKYRKKMIRFRRSHIHGWGLFALESIAPDEMIVEYIGQQIRHTVAEKRENSYEKMGIGSSYLFRIDSDMVIDATKAGNMARFINHSCSPSCYAKIVTMDGVKRIVIYSKMEINSGDEITYDYKFPLEDEKIPCLCGAPNCKGNLN